MALRRALVVAWAGIAVLVMVGAAAAAGRGAMHAGGTFVNANGQSIGWVRLVEDGAGIVHVNVHVSGLTPGLHGIHIHAVGACAPAFAAAGGHYNPLGNYFCAHAILKSLVNMLNPKPLSYGTGAAIMK